MSGRESKSQLIARLRMGRAEWDAAVSAVRDYGVPVSRAAGEWSAKEIVFHLTFYESWMADLLDEVREGRPHRDSPYDALGADELNERVFRASQGHGVDETLRVSKAYIAH